MSWRIIDFQGIISLDQSVVEQLDHFLNEQESRLAQHILDLIPVNVQPFAPTLPIETSASIKLSEAVDGFAKKVRFLDEDDFRNEEPNERVMEELNRALWDFTEIIESCISELFNQIDQVPIDRWGISIFQVVNQIKEILIHRIEDLMWAIRRLEKPLKEYCTKRRISVKKGGLSRLFFWKKSIDPSLFKNLEGSEKVLREQYDAFYDRYQEYVRYNAQIEEVVQKLKKYPILSFLDSNDQTLYLEVFRLVKLWEMNKKSKKGSLGYDTKKALKYLTSVNAISNVFLYYYTGIKEALFNNSLTLKSMNEEGALNQESLQFLEENTLSYRQELQDFMLTISQYREFLLKTNSSPYVRARWGFPEWIVGREPVKAQKLQQLVYSAETLLDWYDSFAQALKEDWAKKKEKEEYANQEIERVLHEMGQPLISERMMRSRVERLLTHIQECHELNSVYMDRIDYIEEVLAKAMRYDWKYLLLQESPYFHEIYEIHEGLQQPVEDPAHSFRIERFVDLFEKIEEWVRQKESPHIHQIELDITDMKTYLQDFLATVQRAAKESATDPFLNETIEKFRHQLLEYRYFFGQFFSTLRKESENSGQFFRNQFLFVDQYFESVEIILHELQANWERRV